MFKSHLMASLFAKCFLFAILTLVFSSCVKHENLVRMQDAASNSFEVKVASNQIHFQDQLQIEVRALDPNTSYFYNIKTEHESDPFNEASLALNSFVVNSQGEINFPKLGALKVNGLTISQLEVILTDSLKNYFTVVFVKAKVVNMKFTVGGEVKLPGAKVMIRDYYTVTEALAMAGDVNDVADISNVRISRVENGVICTHILDLRKAECMKDPFFIVRPNDEIYIQPTRMKALEANLSPVRTALLFLTTTFAIIRLF
jgi:polysaccharide export outer membrane protein